MKRVQREIQKCINRFEFALLVYYDGDNGFGLHDIFGSLEGLLSEDLLKTFRKHSMADANKKEEAKVIFYNNKKEKELKLKQRFGKGAKRINRKESKLNEYLF